MSCKKGVLRNFAKFIQEKTCARVSFLNKVAGQACNFIKKSDSGTCLFLYEFCEISKNTFCYRTPPVAAYKMDITAIMFASKTRELMQYRSEKESQTSIQNPFKYPIRSPQQKETTAKGL